MRILLVKTSSLGDIVHAMPVLYDISTHYPLDHIVWLIEESFMPLLKTHKHINKIISIYFRKCRKNLFTTADLSTLKKIKNFYKNLNATKYDYIIDMQGLIKSGVFSKLAKNQSSLIYGYANKSQQAGYEPLARLAYTHTIKIPYKC